MCNICHIILYKVVLLYWLIYLMEIYFVFLRLLDKWLVMIHVQKNMQKFTTIGQMFKKHFMQTQQAFLISGLLAGELFMTHIFKLYEWLFIVQFKDWLIINHKFLFIWCSEVLNRNWNDTDVSVLPLYRELIAHGVRVWVFRLVFKCIYKFLLFVFKYSTLEKKLISNRKI